VYRITSYRSAVHRFALDRCTLNVSTGARLATAALLLASHPIAAQSSADTTRLPAEVVTATRLPGTVRTPTATATVLDGTALRAEGVTHLVDALRRVPGIALARTSSFGSQTALFMRGGQSNYVRLLIDGVPYNEPGGVLDLGRITLDDVERIEIVRGPASVLYGSEAVTGVIQLFTRRGGAPATRAELGGGSFGGRRASLGSEGRIAGFAWTLQGDHHGSDGILAYNNAYRNDALAASLALISSARSDLRFTSRYVSSNFQYPTGSSGALEDRNAQRSEHRTLLGLDGGHRWSDRLDTRVQLAAHTLHPRTSDGPDNAGDTLGFFGYNAFGVVTRRLADVRTTYRAGKTHFITVAGEFSRDVEESESVSLSEFGDFPDSFRAARETRALSLQGLGDIGPLAYSIGGRVDDNSAFGTFRTLRSGLAWAVAPAVRVRLSAGSAFKAPSFFENFATGFTLGNAALRPERSRSAELGVETVLGNGTMVRVTGFAQRFRDLIQYTGAPPTVGAPNYYNIAAANAGGVEFELGLPAIAGVQTSVGHTWTETRVVDAGFDSGASANFVAGQGLIRRPTHVSTLQLLRAFGASTVSATVVRTGAREDRNFATFPATPVELAAYTTVDLAGDLALPARLLRGARLTLRAENVGNVGYEGISGFRAPGRALYAGLKLQR
jgi:vitamin B12 transporter